MSEHAAAAEHEEAPGPAVTEDGKRVRVKAPDGEYVTIPTGNLDVALSHGYQPESALEYAARKYEEKEGLGGAVKAYGLGAASTATLGASDVIGGELGGEKFREGRRLGSLAYPTLSTAGEITGMILPALIPGGGAAEAANIGAHGAVGAAEAVNLGAHAVEAAEGASLLSRAAGAAGTIARNTPAGLALRAGEGASELVGHGLGALGLTGESLLGRVASSGLKMAAGGAVEGAAFGAGGALSEAALAPGGDYDGIAQKLWAGAIHGAEFGGTVGGGLGVGGELLGAAARKIGGTFSAREALRDFADAKTLKTAGLESADIATMARENPGRVHEVAETLRNEEGIGWLDSAKTRATKIEAARTNADEVVTQMRKGLDDARAPGEGVNVRGVLDEATARTEQLKAQAKTLDQDRVLDKMTKEIDRMKKNFAEGEPASFEAAHDLRQRLDDTLEHYPHDAPKPDPFGQQLRALRDDLENEFSASADKVMAKTTPEFNAQYADAVARRGALEEISTVSKKRAEKLSGGGYGSLVDAMAGITGFATKGPGGILAAAASRAVRSTQADHVIGKLASEIAKFDQHIESAAGRWASKSHRAAKGAEAVLEAPPIPHAAGHSAIHEAIEHIHEVGKVTTSSTLHVRSEAAEQRERVEEYFHKLHAAEHEAKAPPGTLVHIPGAPETEKAAERVRRNSAAWLVSQAPVSPAQIEHPMLARIARQMKPNPIEVTSWMRKVKTVEDPKFAIKAFEDGRLTTDHVDALENSKPAVLAQLRTAVVERITAKNADIGWNARKQLGILLGIETDPSLRPEAIAMGQEVYAEARSNAAAAQQAPQAPAPSAAGQAPRKGTSSRIDVLEEGGAF